MELKSLVVDSLKYVREDNLNSGLFRLLDYLVIDETYIELGCKTTWNCKKLILDRSILDNKEKLGYSIIYAFIKNTMLLGILINNENTECFKRLLEVFDLKDLQDIKITQKDIETYMYELLNFNIYSGEEVKVVTEIDECIIFNCSLYRLNTRKDNTIDVYLVDATGLVYNKRDCRLEDNDYITSSGISVRELKETNDILNSLV